jgi:hypothetical protein
MSSTLRDAEYWRNRAREARALAEQTSDPEGRRELLKIAETYERLAQLAESGKS